MGVRLTVRDIQQVRDLLEDTAGLHTFHVNQLRHQLHHTSLGRADVETAVGALSEVAERFEEEVQDRADQYVEEIRKELNEKIAALESLVRSLQRACEACDIPLGTTGDPYDDMVHGVIVALEEHPRMQAEREGAAILRTAAVRFLGIEAEGTEEDPLPDEELADLLDALPRGRRPFIEHLPDPWEFDQTEREAIQHEPPSRWTLLRRPWPTDTEGAP